MQNQQGGHSCGRFGITFVAEILDGYSPTEAVFAVREMCGHLTKWLENQKLNPFPKA